MGRPQSAVQLETTTQTMKSQSAKLTPKQVGARLAVSEDKVRSWIRSGELPAMDLGSRPGGRPRYRIDPDDLESFLQRRLVRTQTASTSRRRKRGSDHIIEFF
jgi:excisionase family DNA binding protein